jgi:hypothetical protein
MAKRDSEQNPAEQNDSGFGTGNEGRMPAGGDDVRGIAGEGEDAFESDDDEDVEDDEEQEGNY